MAREFKDSGIEWIGQIPKEWNEKPLKYSCKLFGRIGFRGYTADDLVAEGEGAITISPSNMNGIDLDFSHCSYLSWSKYEESPEIMVRVGDVLLVKTASVGKCSYVGSMPMECTVNPQILVLKEHKDCPKYIAYIFQTALGQAYIDVTKGGTTISTISQEKIGNYVFPFPSVNEQQKIADYLDKVCGEVDEMVALQETMIEELKAYKQSVITEAVTKGLNPNVPMRNSGIDWIGEIPEHWEIRRMKYLSNVVRGGSPRPAGDTRYYEGNIPFMKVADITKDENIYVNSCDYSIKEAGLPHTRLINPGTLLLSNSGATLGIPKINTFITTFNDGIAAFLNLDKRIDIVFAYYSLKARTKYFLQSASLGIGQPNLNTDIIGNTFMLIPPIDEQQAIVSYLNTKCSEIDSLIALKQAKIEELKEYKKSVIYEYVTGKKEVV